MKRKNAYGGSIQRRSRSSCDWSYSSCSTINPGCRFEQNSRIRYQKTAFAKHNGNSTPQRFLPHFLQQSQRPMFPAPLSDVRPIEAVALVFNDVFHIVDVLGSPGDSRPAYLLDYNVLSRRYPRVNSQNHPFDAALKRAWLCKSSVSRNSSIRKGVPSTCKSKRDVIVIVSNLI
jgi:hypothetical protein